MKKILSLTGMALLMWISCSSAAPTAEDLPGVPLSTVKKVHKVSLTPSVLQTEKNKISKEGSATVTINTPTVSDSESPQSASGANVAKVEKHNNATNPSPASSFKKSSAVSSDEEKATVAAVKIVPGENAILSVSRHPNRILTPFAHPKIKTKSSATIETEGSVIYVSPKDTSVITMFVTEKDGSPRNALSMTLVPRNIPPMEITLLVDDMYASAGGGGMYGFNNGNAEKWEKKNPYIDTLTSVLSEVAKGNTPSGYGFRLYNSEKDPQVTCSIDGLIVEEGQTLDGHNVIAVISRAYNATDKVIELDEQKCLGKGTLASAAWPNNLLAPGQQTEVYVLFKRQLPSSDLSTRPSLLGK